MNPAQSARLSKEKYPNEWCKAKGCLWRTATRQGYKPCPKHSPIAAEWHDPAKCDHPECRTSEAMRSGAVRVVGAVEETRRGDGVSVISPTASSLPPSRLHNADCLCKHCTMPLPF